MKDRVLTGFRERFPDLTVEMLVPGGPSPLVATTAVANTIYWRIYNRYLNFVASADSGAPTINSPVMMQCICNEDRVALCRDSSPVINEFKRDMSNFESIVTGYFPETNAGKNIRGDIMFIMLFPGGDALVHQDRGMLDFPVFPYITWAEFCGALDHIGGSLFQVDTNTNTRVLRIEPGKSDFAAVIYMDVAPPVLMYHLRALFCEPMDFRLLGFSDIHNCCETMTMSEIGSGNDAAMRGGDPEVSSSRIGFDTSRFIMQRLQNDGTPIAATFSLQQQNAIANPVRSRKRRGRILEGCYNGEECVCPDEYSSDGAGMVINDDDGDDIMRMRGASRRRA